MNIPTTATATTAVAPAAAKRSWKEFRSMVYSVIWSYLTYPSRKVSELGSWALGKVKEAYTAYVYLPAQAFISKTIYVVKATVYGLAGTATICAALTGGLVYGGVFSSDDVKDAIVEIAPRSWLQAAHYYGITVPYETTANADGYVRKSVGL